MPKCAVHCVPRRMGGSAALEIVTREFVLAAGGCDTTIALLMQGGRGWQKIDRPRNLCADH